MCLNMLFLSLMFGFGYFDHRTHGWWNTHSSQCPSYDPMTHECYELMEETRSCMTYVVDCCDFDTNRYYNGYCRLCMKLSSRPCVMYKCVSRGCCNGWYEDQFGRCTIPEEEAEIQCRNDGVRLENNTCQCVGHFTGTKCQKPICEPPCENNGQCELVEEKPTCVCPSKYFRGNFCENVHCESTCLHGGQCVKDGVIATCQCAHGYRGPACEVLTSDMCPIMPDDLETSACSRAKHECHLDNDCPDYKVCCWDGCAGVCKKPDEIKCYHDNQVFSVGDMYKQDACTVCVCQPLGEMKCEQMTCEELTCPGIVNPLPLPGQCCPKCPGTDPPFMPRGPEFINCPVHYVEANVGKNSRVADINNLRLVVEDYKGTELSVTYSQTEFLHSGQTDIRTNTHIVYAYSEADRYGRRAECQVKVIVRDRQSPKLSSCPYDQWANDNEMVTWVPPVPTDNVGIYRLTVVGDEHLNSTLSAGAYSVSYTAFDFDQNQAICSFIINVFESSHHWPSYNNLDDFPSGTVVGMTTGFILVMFFSIWVCVRVRQNQKAERAERAAETDTIASTAESGTTSTVYAMAGRVADMFPNENANDIMTKGNLNDIRMKDIKLPEYSPPVAPPSYEELTETEKHWDQAASLPIYETIPAREGSDVNLVEQPRYENIVDSTEYNNAVGGVEYENVGAGAENPAYTNIPE